MYYFDVSERPLTTLEDGEITTLIENVARPYGAGGSITDSGVGFDTASVAGTGSIEALHGRGLQLVESLAMSLRFNAAGNEAKAVYTWS